MWHYIGNKTRKINSGKLWVWKALDRITGYLIDWECGGRNRETLEKLITRLDTFDVKVYYTDTWHVYETLLPASKYVQTKSDAIVSDAFVLLSTSFLWYTFYQINR